MEQAGRNFSDFINRSQERRFIGLRGLVESADLSDKLL